MADARQLALGQGATATINNRDPIEAQVAEIARVTGGNFARVLDASAYGGALAIQALESASTVKGEKWFSTVDDW